MLDTRRTQVEPVASQVTSTSSQVTEPLIVKDQRTARPTYGSTTPEVLPKDGRKVVVSDQILVSAVANLSTAVCAVYLPSAAYQRAIEVIVD